MILQNSRKFQNIKSTKSVRLERLRSWNDFLDEKSSNKVIVSILFCIYKLKAEEHLIRVNFNDCCRKPKSDFSQNKRNRFKGFTGFISE